MKPIAIFYHCLFFLEGKGLLPSAVAVVAEQMGLLEKTGLLAAAKETIIGVNGGWESQDYATVFLPPNARKIMHGMSSRNENLTIVELEKWVKTHPDWYVFYHHAKGATWAVDDPGFAFRCKWRRCMERHLIHGWRNCVADLDAGCEVVGTHFMEPPQTPAGQRIFAGNFWWAKSNYLATVPSIYLRDRIKQSGIMAVESRYESEVWLCNGNRVPRYKDYHGPLWNPSRIATCSA